MSTKNCVNCRSDFEIEDYDKAFYAKIKVPEPTHCPLCRLQRRIAWRNERVLFKRQCDMCKKAIVSTFDGSVPFPVYCPDCFWSDKWDPTEYGQDFDFGKTFFEQFENLLNRVPKESVLRFHNENSDYNSALAYSKNTYMSPGSYYMEDCIYAGKSQYCKDCLGSVLIDHCELVALSANCKDCYNCHNLINCRSCSDCGYVADSSGCQYCFMCSGITNRRFNIKNKQYSEEEYRRIVSGYMSKDPEEVMQEYRDFGLTIPKKYQNQLNCENSSGDYIQNCKNAHQCYDCFDMEDCKYLIECVSVKDSMDLSMHDKDIELCYELCTGGESSKNTRFSCCAIASPNCDYLNSCHYISDSFGCDGFHLRGEHYILNKKYSPQDYKWMKEQIIAHMVKTGEYGEFMPIRLSYYPYNQTLAQDYFPLTREEALSRGYKWKDIDPKQYKQAGVQVPKNIEEVPDNIAGELLSCEKCSRNYKIISQELSLYKKMHLPAPRACPECRYMDLMKMKNPRHLYDRKCNKCDVQIKTTYSPERPEIVYCENCYLKEIY